MSSSSSHGRLRFYLPKTVYEESLNRIRYLFDEFEDVIVSFSGGKDSTVIFNLALIVAREKQRLPLKVLFLDQEAELLSTIDTVRQVMHHPDVDPLWYQIPFRLFNATSTVEHWLHCWNPDDEARWMRPKEPDALTENSYGTDRFVDLLIKIMEVDFKDRKACYLSGIRCEESPRRTMGMTEHLTYKHITWGLKISARHFSFSPIYDWSFVDVWKAIHDNGWSYNRHYDSMYRYGVSRGKMRVSSLNHETSIPMLFMLQEIEPETYERMTARLSGIDTAAKMNFDDYFPKRLPFMFKSWVEYRDHLLKHLITDPAWTKLFTRRFQKQDVIYGSMGETLTRVQIKSILTNDWEGVVGYDNFRVLKTPTKLRKAYRDAQQAKTQAMETP